MQLKDELPTLLLMAMIMKYVAPASRHHINSKLFKIRRGDSKRVDRLSYGSVSTHDGLRSTPHDGDELDSAEFQQPDEVDDPTLTGLRRPVHHADAKKLVDGGRPTESADLGRQRRRRSLRPTITKELEETKGGQLLTLGTDYAERFAFKDPAPRQLDISAVMGNVLLRDGHRLDYETEPEIEFVVIVTRVDDVACEYYACVFYFSF